MNNVNTILDNAIKALDDELQALSQARHESHRLHKGRLLGQFDRAHVYSFDVPNVNIADGTSVNLLVREMNRDARFDSACVLGYQGANIILSSVDNPGLANQHPCLHFEPGFMLKVLCIRLRELQDSPANANFALLAKLFAAPEPADPPDDANKPTAALVDAALAQPVSFLWSPEGTHQDEFIAACATRIAAEGGSALVLSPTTEQTDAQTLLLADSPAAKTIVRVGAPLPDALKALQGYSPYSLACQRDPLTFELLDRLAQQIADLLDAVGSRKPNREIRLKLDELEREKSRLEQFAWEAEQHVINNASIMLSPLNRAVTHQRVYGRRYDVVIVSSVQQALLAQIVWASTLAEKAVILVGDFRQNPNWIKSRSLRAVRWLKQNVFEASGIVRSVNRGDWDSRLQMLQTQQTMDPQISRILNEVVYGGRLLNAPKVAERTTLITAQPPEPGKAVVFYDARYLQPHTHVTEDRGYCSNVLTAALSLRVVGSLLSQGNPSVLLMTPYIEQLRLHRALIRDAKVQHLVTTTQLCRCVSPQHDIVVLDLVDTAPLLQVGYPLRDGWGSETMLQLSAAFSAARSKIILIGDWALLQQTLPDLAVMRRFLNEMLRGGAAIKPFPIGLLRPNVRPKNLAFYADPGEAWSVIAQDIAAASQRVMWNWPFGNADEIFNPGSLSWLFSAKAKRTLASSLDDPVRHPLAGHGLKMARSIHAEAGVQIDDSIFWLIGNSYPDGTTRPFVRVSGQRATLQIGGIFGLNTVFRKGRSRPTR